MRLQLNLLLSLICVAAASGTLPENEALRLHRADHLLDTYHYRQALEIFEKVLETKPQNVHALCQASFLHGEVGRGLGRKAKEKEFRKALSLAKRAYGLSPDNAESNFAMAWASGGIALISGAHQRVKSAHDVKKFVERALELNPDNDRAWYILANWNLRVATAGWAEKLAARLLYGGLPADASLSKGEAAFRRAIRLRPDSILYRWELARLYRRTGEKVKEGALLKKTAGLAPQAPGDDRLLQDCKERLRELRH